MRKTKLALLKELEKGRKGFCSWLRKIETDKMNMPLVKQVREGCLTLCEVTLKN